jgi:hypothetical protein
MRDSERAVPGNSGRGCGPLFYCFQTLRTAGPRRKGHGNETAFGRLMYPLGKSGSEHEHALPTIP